MLPLPLFASLIFLPTLGSGLSGEFLLKTPSSNVVLIFNTTLNGNRACYIALDALLPKAYVYNDATGDWIGDGVNCSVGAFKEGEWVRLRIKFSQTWQGEKTIYVLETGSSSPSPAVWYRAGVWNVRNESIQALPPSPFPQGPRGIPGPPGPPGPQGIPGPPVTFLSETLKPDPEGRYPGGYSLYFRNGIYQTDKVDYNTVEGKILPLSVWEMGDVVTGISFSPSIQLLIPFFKPAIPFPMSPPQPSRKAPQNPL